MTEASENAYLVRVRAQVMCRDEGTGGWIALGGGGLAHVMVGRRPHAHRDSESSDTSPVSGAPVEPPLLPFEYYIHGKRISDNMVVLECTIRSDFQYNKVMPTFHHWSTGDKRFGLTFQTAADARAFDKGVRRAVDELSAARRNILSDDSGDIEAPECSEGFEGPRITDAGGWGGVWPSVLGCSFSGSKDEEDEANIFECLNLPSESRSSSENSTTDRAHRRHADLSQTPILSAINLPAHEPSLKQLSHGDPLDQDSERCSYVHLSAVHEYTYPVVTSGGVISSVQSSPNTKPALSRDEVVTSGGVISSVQSSPNTKPALSRDEGSLKKPYGGPPPLPDKKPTDTYQARLKCRHCHEWYLESANRAGACEYAPDCCKSCIDFCSCIKCAQCMLYHCMSDAEGDFAMHPCACAAPDANCAKRWLGLTLLSLVVPCLCCYLPLRAAHRAARAAHIAGGLHAPCNTAHRHAPK